MCARECSQFHAGIRDLYGRELYTESNAKPTEFMPVVSIVCSFPAQKSRTANDRYQRNLDLFVVSSRY